MATERCSLNVHVLQACKQGVQCNRKSHVTVCDTQTMQYAACLACFIPQMVVVVVMMLASNMPVCP
eukprot:11186847-Lingulodinium_polyedra.AAC.2